MDKKFKLEAVSELEQKEFNDGLMELANKYNIVMSIIPQFKPNPATEAFEVTGMLLIQKKVEVTEEVKEPEIISPLSEELQKDESAPAA